MEIVNANPVAKSSGRKLHPATVIDLLGDSMSNPSRNWSSPLFLKTFCLVENLSVVTELNLPYPKGSTLS